MPHPTPSRSTRPAQADEQRDPRDADPVAAAEYALAELERAIAHVRATFAAAGLDPDSEVQELRWSTAQLAVRLAVRPATVAA